MRNKYRRNDRAFAGGGCNRIERFRCFKLHLRRSCHGDRVCEGSDRNGQAAGLGDVLALVLIRNVRNAVRRLLLLLFLNSVRILIAARRLRGVRVRVGGSEPGCGLLREARRLAYSRQISMRNAALRSRPRILLRAGWRGSEHYSPVEAVALPVLASDSAGSSCAMVQATVEAERADSNAKHSKVEAQLGYCSRWRLSRWLEILAEQHQTM